MEAIKVVISVIYIIAGAYILYFFLYRKNPLKDEYEKLYNEILNSDKHKIKGQFDKRY